jgi:acetoin utilization deacetylase AcuC-like enzyme
MKQLHTIPVFYRQEMVADSQSFSPSASKPQHAVRSWQDRGMPIELRSFRPATLAQMYDAHDRRYIDDVIAQRRPNGFGNHSERVAKSLRYTSGSLYAAARAALDNGQVACSPTSGFHHATYYSGGGFCTFNGLMVTAIALKREGRARKIGILDLDQHYGNGTDDIIDKLGIEYVRHFTGGEKHRRAGKEATAFLRNLPTLVRSFADCDILIYQAGADPHVNDPLGGWLTTRELAQRDRIVFETARDMGLPVAWNLAGGYQDPLERVLEIHDNTMEICADVFTQTILAKAA